MQKSKLKTEWDLSPLFNNDDDPKIELRRKEIEKNTDNFINKWKNRDDYLKNPVILEKALDDYEKIQRNYGINDDLDESLLGDEGYYFWLRTQQDQTDPKIKAKLNKIEDFTNKIENNMKFFILNISKIPVEKQKEFLISSELKKYKHFLERLFLKSKHLLSEEEEKIMTLKSSPSHSNWIRMTSSFLSKEEKEIIDENGKKNMKNFSEIQSLLSNKNKSVRDNAAKVFNDILKKHIEEAETEINSILQNKKIDDELRNFPRPDSERHLNDDIGAELVDTLIKTVSENFDLSQRYYKLKAKLLKVKKLEYHERNVPYGEIEKKYSYGEAVNLIYKVFSNLDKKFLEISRNFIENGHIDVYPKKGKRSGAFCSYHLISQPTYISLNYTDKLDDILTLAHELGHGINNELIKEKQNSLYFATPLATAEVASTFMEDFILQEIMNNTDNQELKLSLMMNKLNDDINTIIRQVACYKFEQELHKHFREKGYLSKEEIGSLFQKNMSSYMGKSVLQSPGSENWWVYWPHIRDFFYVYSYASGLLISKSLQNSVKKNPKFIEKLKEFLSAGKSDSPKNIFLKLGINIEDKNFWLQGLEEIENLLDETEKLAKKLGKI